MSASSPAVPAVTGPLSPSAHLDWSLDEPDHSDSLTMNRGQGSRTPNHDQQDGDKPRTRLTWLARRDQQNYNAGLAESSALPDLSPSWASARALLRKPRRKTPRCIRDQPAHLLVVKGTHPGLDPLIAKIAGRGH
jgi:hypothetical protein